MGPSGKSGKKKSLKRLYEKLMNHSYLHALDQDEFFDLFEVLKDNIPFHTLLLMEFYIPKEIFITHGIDFERLISNRVNSAFKDCHSKIPIFKLLDIESRYQFEATQPNDVNIGCVINDRINRLNEYLKSELKDYVILDRENLNSWFEELKIDRMVSISSLDLLANIAKEMPPYGAHYERLVECLISRINSDERIRVFLGKIAINDVKFDHAIETLRKDITKILSDFDTTYNIRTYLKKVLTWMILSTYKEDPITIDVNNRPDEGSVSEPADDQVGNELYKLITISLLIFTEVRVKPHMKIIFWHQNSYYIIADAKKKIDHHLFMSCHLDDTLGFLFELTLEKLRMYIEKLDEFEDFEFDFEGKISDVILPQFDKFKTTLDESISSIYTEPEYKLIRDRQSAIKVADVVTINFFKKENDTLMNDSEIKKLISNWNTRIKKEIKKILENPKSNNTIPILRNDQ